MRDGIEAGLNGHWLFQEEAGGSPGGCEGGYGGGVGALRGLETGTPSCLASPPATWARRSPGGRRPNLC